MPDALLIIALCFAIAYLFVPAGGRPLPRAVVKTVPVTLMAVTAAWSGLPLLLVAALGLSALGDWLLAFAGRRDDDTEEPNRAFLAGLLAFLAGHVVYIVLFASSRLGNQHGYEWLIGMAMVLFAIAMSRPLWRHAGPLRWPVMAYVATIGAMGLVSLMTGSTVLVLGAIAFMASDALIGMERFVIGRGQTRLRAMAGPAIWVLYIAAQFLILFAFL